MPISTGSPVMNEYARSLVGLHRATMFFSSCSSVWGLPPSPGDLYDDSAYSDIDPDRCQNIGRTAFGTYLGIKTNQGRAVQYV